MRLLCSDRDSGVILGLIRVLLDFICSNGSARIVDITSTREAFGTAFIDSGTTYTIRNLTTSELPGHTSATRVARGTTSQLILALNMVTATILTMSACNQIRPVG